MDHCHESSFERLWLHDQDGRDCGYMTKMVVMTIYKVKVKVSHSLIAIGAVGASKTISLRTKWLMTVKLAYNILGSCIIIFVQKMTLG